MDKEVEIIELETDLDRELEAFGKGKMLNNAPKFDPNLYYYTSEFTDLVEEYLPTVMKLKRPSGETQWKYFNHIFWFLSNLLRAQVIYNGWVAISMSKSTYSSRYMKNISYRQLIVNTVNQWIEMGLLEKVTGVNYAGLKRLSRIRAAGELAAKLNAIEIDMSEFRYATRGKEWIELRGIPVSQFNKETRRMAKYNPKIEYEDTDETNRMRENLNDLNSLIANTKIDLFVTDEEFKNVFTDHSDGYLRPLDLTKKYITRKFTHGSFEKGGRFYEGWWMAIPKDYRRYITIDGVPTVECDYTGIHPTMLYYLAKETRPYDDPYHIPAITNLIDRGSIKLATNVMINSNDYDSAIEAIEHRSEELDKDGNPKIDLSNITALELAQAIEGVHHRVDQFFYSGIGVGLQRMDSDIAEEIMLHFLRKGEVVLPVHDSFLV